MLTYCPLVAKYTSHIRKTNIYIYLFYFTLLANKCESNDTPCGGNLTLRYTIITFITTTSYAQEVLEISINIYIENYLTHISTHSSAGFISLVQLAPYTLFS